MVQNVACCLTLSEATIKRELDFLMKKLGLKQEILASASLFIKYPEEKSPLLLSSSPPKWIKVCRAICAALTGLRFPIYISPKKIVLLRKIFWLVGVEIYILVFHIHFVCWVFLLQFISSIVKNAYIVVKRLMQKQFFTRWSTVF